MKNYFLKKVISLFYSSSVIKNNLKYNSKKMYFFPGGVNFEKIFKV